MYTHLSINVYVLKSASISSESQQLNLWSDFYTSGSLKLFVRILFSAVCWVSFFPIREPIYDMYIKYI